MESKRLAVVYGPPAFRVSSSGDERAVLGVLWKNRTVYVAAVSGVEWSHDASRTEPTRVERVEAWSAKSDAWYALGLANEHSSPNADFSDEWSEWTSEVAPERLRITMGGVHDPVEFNALDQGAWPVS